MSFEPLPMGNQALENAVLLQRLQILTEKGREGYFETDDVGNLLFYNNAFARLISSRHTPQPGQPLGDYFVATGGDSIPARIQRILARGGGEGPFGVVLSHSADRENRLQMDLGFLVRERRGKGCFGFIQDTRDYAACQIREQQCSADLDHADQRSRQRFRTFMDFLPDPVCVFNPDDTVAYLNPAFERVFGWSLDELMGQSLPFVPANEKASARNALSRLNKTGIVHGIEGRRLTRDGRLLDVIMGAAVYSNERNTPAGIVVTVRDVTREKRIEKTQRTLFRIALALHQHHALVDLLRYIIDEIRALLDVEGASVILLDEKRQEFFLPFTAHEDPEASRRISAVRLPVDRGAVGYVYRTGQPLIIPDTSRSDLFLKEPDLQTGYQSRSVLDVPLRHNDRMIGVLMAVNKKNGAFDQDDVELLLAVAGLVALPLENAHIHHELERSYDKVNRLNRAKDRVIHHLSHELKTPLAILKASLQVLGEKLGDDADESLRPILARSDRNVDRLLNMQYEIADMLNGGSDRHHRLMTRLLDACRDALEALSADHPAAGAIHNLLKEKIEANFGPSRAVSRQIALAPFVSARLKACRPGFAHRDIELIEHLASDAVVRIPVEVLEKAVDGLVRNAVENTPDGGRIEVIVSTQGPGGADPEARLIVRDYGVGMTAEKQKLILEHYFSASDPLHYAARQPYEFGAGGKGFDLLRLTIFSERYDFKYELVSRRCRFLAAENATCPGKIGSCGFCQSVMDCRGSGGTMMTIAFRAVSAEKGDEPFAATVAQP